MNSLFDKIYDALRSIKLAVALLVLLALFAIVGGIIPQGKPVDYYLTQFPGTGARIILALGVDHIFSSIGFLLVAAIFAMNLTVCTLHRLANEFTKPFKKRRHGPDLLHLGLIILLFGGILTARTRSESVVNLRKGESAILPDGSTLALVDLVYEQYPDGRPKSFESIVSITRAANASAGATGATGTAGATGPGTTGAAAATAATTTSTGTPPALRHIKVNAPLRGKGFSVYQQNWHAEQQAELSDAVGLRFRLDPGMREEFNDGFVLFMATGQATGKAAEAMRAPGGTAAAPANSTAPQPADPSRDAIFLLEKGGKRTVVKAAPGQPVGPFTFSGLIDESVSGLAIVTDKGYPYVEAGFILVILGVFITYLSKLKGMLA